MLKLIVTVMLALFLMIPSTMIMYVVQERQDSRIQAEAEIGQKLGQAQTITGPIISINDSAVNSFTHFLPSKLEIKSEIEPEIRYRGLFKIAVYKTKINLKGSFDKLDLKQVDNIQDKISFDKSYLQIGISDMRGIKNALSINLNGKSYPLKPSLKANNVFSSYYNSDPKYDSNPSMSNNDNGVHIQLSDLKLVKNDSTSTYNFDVNLELSGSKELKFVPIGKTTTVEMSSKWGNPSFIGDYLPIEKNVTDNNFTAKWNVLEFNRSFPQIVRNNNHNIMAKSFGVSLLIPIDGYAQTNRAIKYSYLFVGLTFIAFFLIEVVNRLRLHPIQYLLVGFALSLFYLMLLSISEYLSFGMAYLSAFIAIVGLITFYTSYAFKNKKISLLLFSLLTLQFGYLYVLLSLEDYSLLLGSFGLFVIIATVMLVTRKLDWYSLGNSSLTDAEIQNSTDKSQ